MLFASGYQKKNPGKTIISFTFSFYHIFADASKRRIQLSGISATTVYGATSVVTTERAPDNWAFTDGHR